MSGSQNSTDESHCGIDSGSLILTLLPAYILVISVLGIVLNAFVLMVFCLHKKACTVAEIYLSNLAAADLFLVCCLPFWADYVRNNYNWFFSESLCKLVPAVISMNVFCSIYFLVLVSIDRFVALVHPLSSARMRRPFYAKLGCVLVWSLGLVFALPALIHRKLQFDPPSNGTACDIDYTYNQYLVSEVMTIIFSFIVPVSIISFCTVRIIQALRNRIDSQTTEQKATNLILAVLLAFLICWVPFHVSKILDVLRHVGILSCHIILMINQQLSVYLAFFNSVLNPVLYIIVGKTFQKRMKELFTQWNNKKTAFTRMSTLTRLTSLKFDNNST